MKDLINTYIQYLINHLEMVNSIILWNLTMLFVWGVQIKYRKKMIDGHAGSNFLFESPEQIAYILNFVWPGILCYAAYFNVDVPKYVWVIIGGTIMYVLGGRWLFEWALAFRAGASKVETKTIEKESSSKETITNENTKL